jgi:hypothetical protein
MPHRFVIRNPFHMPVPVDDKGRPTGSVVMKQRGDELTADEVELIRKLEPSLIETHCVRSHAVETPVEPESAPWQSLHPAAQAAASPAN